jgi:hypothetical protein
MNISRCCGSTTWYFGRDPLGQLILRQRPLPLLTDSHTLFNGRSELEFSGERTKKAAVTKALEEFIARRRLKRILELMGKLEWDNSFDYKAERSHS